MLRAALVPRRLALLAVALLLATCFTWLGSWQMEVAQSRGHEQMRHDRLVTPPRPLEGLLTPHTRPDPEILGYTVRVTGRFDGTRQVLITPRRLDGRTGSWLVAPLRVQGSAAVVPVVRGFVPDAAVPRPPSAASTTSPVPTTTPAPTNSDAAALADGLARRWPTPDAVVTVTGLLAPAESPPDRAVPIPAGHLQSVDTAVLVNRWPDRLYDAMVFPTTGEHHGPGAAVLHVTPPDLLKREFNWRNLGYALQWWVFAAFVLFFWWRLVRDDVRRSTVPSGTEPSTSIATDPPIASPPTTPRPQEHST